MTVRMRFDAIFDEPGSIRAMAVLRLALGPVVFVHLWPFLAEIASGVTFDQQFHDPWVRGLSLPGWVQVVAVVGAALGAGAMTVGWQTRFACAVTTAGVATNLFLSRTHFHHNRAFLLILLAGVTLSASGRVLSIDSWWVGRAKRQRAGRANRMRGDRTTIWPLWLTRALVASVYGASGFSKLTDPDWLSGLVNWDRSVRYERAIHEQGLPDFLATAVADVVTTRGFHTVTAPLIIATELAIALGLWFRPTRLAAVWLALAFHVGIEVSASVQVFSLAGIAALVLWVTPRTRDRVVYTDDPRLRRCIWLLDWTARFDVRSPVLPGAPLAVRDRDGQLRTGRAARWLVWSRLPITFPLVFPVGVALRRRAIGAVA